MDGLSVPSGWFCHMFLPDRSENTRMDADVSTPVGFTIFKAKISRLCKMHKHEIPAKAVDQPSCVCSLVFVYLVCTEATRLIKPTSTGGLHSPQTHQNTLNLQETSQRLLENRLKSATFEYISTYSESQKPQKQSSLIFNPTVLIDSSQNILWSRILFKSKFLVI